MPIYGPPGPGPMPPPPPPVPPGQNGNSANPATAGFNPQSQTQISSATVVPSQLISQPTLIVSGNVMPPMQGNNPGVPIPPVKPPLLPAPIRRAKSNGCGCGCNCGCGNGNQAQTNLTPTKEVAVLAAPSNPTHGSLPGTGILLQGNTATIKTPSAPNLSTAQKPCGCGGTTKSNKPSLLRPHMKKSCGCGCIPCCCNEKKPIRRSIPKVFSPKPIIPLEKASPLVSGLGSQIITQLHTQIKSQILSSTPNFTYQGGPLLTSVNVIPIFWGSAWTDSSGIGAYVSEIQGFFDWILKSPVMDFLNAEYNVPPQPGQTPYQIGYGSRVTPTGSEASNFIITDDVDKIPNSVDDLTIQGRITAWITKGYIPENVSGQSLYFIFTEDGINFITVGDGSAYCPDNSKTYGACSYHWAISPATGNLAYAVIPFPCEWCISFNNASSMIDAITILISHELPQAIVTPYENPPSLDLVGWDANYGGGIADVCDGLWEYAQDEETGAVYAVRNLWSRTTNACVPPASSKMVFDYSVKNAPAIASYPTYAGDALVIAWTESVALPNFPFGRIFIMNNISDGGFGSVPPIILQDSSNPNPELSIDSPALSYGPGNNFYVAWTGNDPGHTLNLMTASWIDLSTWASKIQLSESSPYGPALAFGNGYLFITWAGTNNQINIRRSSDGVTWNDSDKVVLQQWTIDSPSLAFVNNTLYLLFKSSNSDQFFIMASTDSGKTFSNPTTIPNQTTDYTPALTQAGSDLILAWRGTDPDHHISAMRASVNSTNPLSSFIENTGLDDTANGGVSLTTFNGLPYIAWGGTDPQNLLNIMPLVSPLWAT